MVYSVPSAAPALSVPSGIPHTTVDLDLQFNQFNSLLEDTFPDLLELSTLYLGNSQVHQIEPAFQGVRNLYHLYLDNCLLEEIPGEVFENLTNLAFLHLEHNHIAYISPGRALPGKLHTLYLDQNQLDKLPGTIRTSTTLSTFHLSDNHISQLTSLSFGQKLRSLKQLFLDNLDLCPPQHSKGYADSRQRFRQIQFRRYYDEDSPSFQCQGIPQSKLTTESVYEVLENHQHDYMTVASQQCQVEYIPIPASTYSEQTKFQFQTQALLVTSNNQQVLGPMNVPLNSS
ncbi:UNVERIFIED_CONTAM: hypothetical protein K2H54_074571 [Gekko kuhli]